jgi:hypothetical protein
MRAYIIFLSICLGVLTIPDGFFSHDGSMDSVAAEYDRQDTIYTIDMSVFEETPIQQEEVLILDLPPIERKLPPAVQIYAPYYSQAPDGNWKLPWSMLCSEANLVLAAYAVTGKPLSKEQFKKDMLAMIPVQEKAFGTYFSIPMRDLKSVYDTMYPDAGRSRILENPSIEDMKQQLAKGNLIIAPTG